MALYNLNYLSSIAFRFMILALFVFMNHCQCFNPKSLNASFANYGSDAYGWSSAVATWYGSPTGAGTDGGACEYRNAVESSPYSSMISAGSPVIYQNGQGCGICYEIQCNDNQACSGNPITVTITDECPGCEGTHFDLSGTAFGALAKSGLDTDLRNAGVLQVEYRMVKCDYPGSKVVVRVDEGSNPYYFAAEIEYVDGSGIAKVEIKQNSGEWIDMEESSGATYALNAGYVMQPPFSLRITDKQSGRTLTLNNVIPVGWQPAQTYRSFVNFDN